MSWLASTFVRGICEFLQEKHPLGCDCGHWDCPELDVDVVEMRNIVHLIGSGAEETGFILPTAADLASIEPVDSRGRRLGKRIGEPTAHRSKKRNKRLGGAP